MKAKKVDISDDELWEDTPIDLLVKGAARKYKVPPTEKRSAVVSQMPPRKDTKQRIVFIVGIDETEKDSIIEMIIKNNNHSLPTIKYIKTESMPKLDGLNLNQINEKMEAFLQKIEKSIEKSAASRNILVSSHLVHKIDSGYIPIFSSEFIAKVRPDFFIFFFVDVESLKSAGGKINTADIKNRQDMNWECIKSYCISGGLPVKMVRVVRGDIKSAAANTVRILKSVFE